LARPKLDGPELTLGWGGALGWRSRPRTDKIDLHGLMIVPKEMNVSEISFYIFTNILAPWMGDGVKLKFLDKYFYENYRPYSVRIYDELVYEWMLDAHTVEYINYDTNNDSADNIDTDADNTDTDNTDTDNTDTDTDIDTDNTDIKDTIDGDNIGRIDFGLFRRLKKLIFKGNGEYVYVPNSGVVEIAARNVILAITDVSELGKLKLEDVEPEGALVGLCDEKETLYLPKLEQLEIQDCEDSHRDLYLVGMPNLRRLVVSGYNVAAIDLPSLVAARIVTCMVPKEIRLPNVKILEFTKVNITAIHAPELIKLSCIVSEVRHLVTPKLKILFLLGCVSDAIVPESVILFSPLVSSCSNTTKTRPVYLLTDEIQVLEATGPNAQNLYLTIIQPGPHIPKGKKVTYVKDVETLGALYVELQKELLPQYLSDVEPGYL